MEQSRDSTRTFAHPPGMTMHELTRHGTGAAVEHQESPETVYSMASDMRCQNLSGRASFSEARQRRVFSSHPPTEPRRSHFQARQNGRVAGWGATAQL